MTTTPSSPNPSDQIDGAAPTLTDASPERRGALAALGYHNFRMLWLGQIVQSEGQWMEQVARGWLIWEMTHDPFVLGLYGALRSLPAFMLALPAGVLSDRFSKVLVIQGAQLSACLMAFIFAVLVQTGTIAVWMVLAFAFLNGTAEIMRMPARQALLSSLVPRGTILNAVAINEVGQYTMRIGGPILAGAVMTAVGDPWMGVVAVFYLRSALYLFAVLVTAMIHLPKNFQPASRSHTMMQNMRETFGYLRSNPLLLAIVLLAVGPAMVGQPYQYLLPIFALEIYGVGPEGLGVLTAAAGAGALLGALLLVALGNVQRMGLVMMGSLFAYGGSLLFFGFTSNFSTALVALLLLGASQAMFQAMRQTLIQLLAKEELRGRVFSVAQLTRGTLSPIGALLAGGIASVLSAPIAMLTLGGFLVSVATGYSIFQGDLRKLSFTAAREAHQE